MQTSDTDRYGDLRRLTRISEHLLCKDLVRMSTFAFGTQSEGTADIFQV